MKPVVCAIVIAAALSACGTLGERRLSRSPEMTSAEGRVRFRTIGGEDTGIDLRVRHLSEPDGLMRPGYAYVAWVRQDETDAPRNVGALGLDGQLRTTAPLRRFELFVTAEATSDASEPTGEPLLWASRE